VPTDLTDLINLTRENVQANALLLEAQRTSTRIKKAILDAKLTLNLIRGQAIIEDGGINIPTVVIHEEGIPSTSTFKPNTSNTPPPPTNSVGINRTLLDANLTLNSMQGQAISEDGNIDIPMVLTNIEEVPLTSTFTPIESNILPPPPSAPLVPPPCPPLPTYFRNYASRQKKWLLKQYW
jgi:hypothetical protein